MTRHVVHLGPFERLMPIRQDVAPQLPARAFTAFGRIARLLVREIAYMVREDRAHGRIERLPEDWEH